LESQLTETESKFLNASDALKHLLGINDDRVIEPTDSLTYVEVEEGNPDYQSILTQRSDLQAYRFRVSALANQHTMNKLKFLPRLNAFGSLEFNDEKIFGKEARNWMVGVNLQWNIFNGFQTIAAVQKTKSELKQSIAEMQKAESNALNEIKTARRDLETARKNLVLANNIVDQSNESLRIIKDRYGKGLEKTTDLLNAETAFASARLKYLEMLFFYNVSLFKLELMNETTTAKKNI
jgi:outer membrane protein TolC